MNLFFLITFSILLGLQALAYFTFINYWKTSKFYKPYHRWIALAPFVIFDLSMITINVVWGRDFDPPEWFRILGMNPFFIWMGATFFISLWLLAGKIIKLPFQIPIWIAKIFRPLREKINRFKERKEVKTISRSRRKFVRYATMGVSAYAFGAATYGLLKHDEYRIEYKDIRIENLPAELKGTTITLICDIHAGQYITEEEMREYADVVNGLGSDIICIPGDFVNFEVKDVHTLTRAFRDLKAKHGIYGTLGNHDFFQNPDYVAKGILNESPIQLLRNQFNRININGKDLYMLGVDDTRDSGAEMDAVVKYYDGVESAAAADPAFNNSPKILLCHKPYAFESFAEKNIDLILAGHTHGGQVVPVKFGNFNLSFASTVSKYIDGLYTIGKANMYVSRGIGSVGLPIRINCPPEVTKITLV